MRNVFGSLVLLELPEEELTILVKIEEGTITMTKQVLSIISCNQLKVTDLLVISQTTAEI